MSRKNPFIPTNHTGKIAKGDQIYGGLSQPGVDLAHFNLSAAELTRFNGVLTTLKSAFADSVNEKEVMKSKTTALSGPGAAEAQYVAVLREFGNKIRVSDATDEECDALGVPRRKPSPTPLVLALDPPGLTLERNLPNFLQLKAAQANSAAARARDPNANGIQIAIVDAANPVAASEADSAPVRYASRNPVKLAKAGMPGHARLYARWQTQTGKVSDWSVPLLVTVR